MCHQARSSRSALTPSSSASSLRFPRVGARTLAGSIASAGVVPRSSGPAAVSASLAPSALMGGVCQAARRPQGPRRRRQRASGLVDSILPVAGLLSIERHEEVALVTLRRPERRNALSIELRLELADAFGRLSGDDDVGCVVLTGAGTAFCSGMDTTQFGGDLEHRKQLVETSTVAFEAVGGCRRPIVAAINGPAIAGGFALALLCDLRIASASAIFGYPELPRGIPPSYAAARAVLPATVAQELCLTGQLVKAEEAQRMGIVREVVEGDVVARGLELGQRIAGLPRKAVLETKRRTLLERRHLWGFLFEDEQEVFRRALLGPEAVNGPKENGEAA